MSSWQKTEFQEYSSVIHAQFLNDLQDYVSALEDTMTEDEETISDVQTEMSGLRYLRTYIGLIPSGSSTVSANIGYIVPNVGGIKVGDYVLSQNLVLTTVSAVGTNSVTLAVVTPFSERNGPLYVDFTNLTYDASGNITGGQSSETFANIKAAYEAGRTITARVNGTLIPLTYASTTTNFTFELTTMIDPSNYYAGYETWRVTLYSNGNISGYFREG